MPITPVPDPSAAAINAAGKATGPILLDPITLNIWPLNTLGAFIVRNGTEPLVASTTNPKADAIVALAGTHPQTFVKAIGILGEPLFSGRFGDLEAGLSSQAVGRI